MKSGEHYLPNIERAQRDLEACELYILEWRAAARALCEDRAARAYASQVADDLVAIVEQHAHSDGLLTLRDALDETLAEEIVNLALRQRHPLLAQPVTDSGYEALQRRVWEACRVLEFFLPAEGAP